MERGPRIQRISRRPVSSRRHIKRALDDGDHRATKVGGLRSDLIFSLCLLLIGIKDGKLVLMVPRL